MKIFISIVALLMGVGFLFYWLQDNFIFFPEKLKQNYRFRFNGLFDELNLESDGEGLINVLVFRCSNPKGRIVYFHGNAGSLRTWGAVAEKFGVLGFEVWVMDYRGYGKSRGERTEKRMMADALLVYDKAIESYDQNNVVVYGRSLGTAFATYVSATRNPNKLILESPFYDLADAASAHVPFVPIRKLLKYEFPNHQNLHNTNAQVLIIHGSKDGVVPLNSALLLKPFLKQQDKFVIVEKAGHNDLENFTLYHSQVDSFLSNDQSANN